MLSEPDAVGGRTRLWRWIVYSRATTSAMADRPGLGVLVVLVVDIADAQWVVSHTICFERGMLRVVVSLESWGMTYWGGVNTIAGV